MEIKKEHNKNKHTKSNIRKEGLNYNKVKLSSKNLEKLLKNRGLSETEIDTLKKSFNLKDKLEVRHAKAGEKFMTTHGMQNCSGIFVSEKSLGKTANERIDRGALPISNSAENETIVELDKNQNIILGKIAPQKIFEKQDPKHVKRSGGETQVITDGGYLSGSIRNKDPKYPVPVKEAFLKNVKKGRVQDSKNKIHRDNTNYKGQERI